METSRGSTTTSITGRPAELCCSYGKESRGKEGERNRGIVGYEREGELERGLTVMWKEGEGSGRKGQSKGKRRSWKEG